jgi:pimeloyl-ACP methyl ester carboxylesterase
MTLRQDVRFCTAADGTRIAIASIGAGPPLVRAAHWLSHVEHDLESPVWRPWLREFARRYTYIRYDQRGCGLSDRSPEAWPLVDLLVTISRRRRSSRPSPLPLIGSQGGRDRHASRHPSASRSSSSALCARRCGAPRTTSRGSKPRRGQPRASAGARR